MTTRTAYDDFPTALCQCNYSFHVYNGVPVHGSTIAWHEFKAHEAGEHLTYAIFAAETQEFQKVIVRTAK